MLVLQETADPVGSESCSRFPDRMFRSFRNCVRTSEKTIHLVRCQPFLEDAPLPWPLAITPGASLNRSSNSLTSSMSSCGLIVRRFCAFLNEFLAILVFEELQQFTGHGLPMRETRRQPFPMAKGWQRRLRLRELTVNGHVSELLRGSPNDFDDANRQTGLAESSHSGTPRPNLAWPVTMSL